MCQSATTAETTWERGTASGTHPRPPLSQSARVALAGSPHGPGAAHRNFPTPRRPDGVFGSREKREPGGDPSHTHPSATPAPLPTPQHPHTGPAAQVLRPALPRPAARQPLAEAALEAGGAHWLEGAVTLPHPPGGAGEGSGRAAGGGRCVWEGGRAALFLVVPQRARGECARGARG